MNEKNFRPYITKILKNIDTRFSIEYSVKDFLNSFCNYFLLKIVSIATNLLFLINKKTLTVDIVEKSISFLLSGELYSNAITYSYRHMDEKSFFAKGS